MRDILVELCSDRAVAEARKHQIEILAPDASWKSHVIEDVATAALFVTPSASPGSITNLEGQTDASKLGRSTGVALVIWAE